MPTERNIRSIKEDLLSSPNGEWSSIFRRVRDSFDTEGTPSPLRDMLGTIENPDEFSFTEVNLTNAKAAWSTICAAYLPTNPGSNGIVAGLIEDFEGFEGLGNHFLEQYDTATSLAPSIMAVLKTFGTIAASLGVLFYTWVMIGWALGWKSPELAAPPIEVPE